MSTADLCQRQEWANKQDMRNRFHLRVTEETNQLNQNMIWLQMAAGRKVIEFPYKI